MPVLQPSTQPNKSGDLTSTIKSSSEMSSSEEVSSSTDDCDYRGPPGHVRNMVQFYMSLTKESGTINRAKAMANGVSQHTVSSRGESIAEEISAHRLKQPLGSSRDRLISKSSSVFQSCLFNRSSSTDISCCGTTAKVNKNASKERSSQDLQNQGPQGHDHQHLSSQNERGHGGPQLEGQSDSRTEVTAGANGKYDHNNSQTQEFCATPTGIKHSDQSATAANNSIQRHDMISQLQSNGSLSHHVMPLASGSQLTKVSGCDDELERKLNFEFIDDATNDSLSQLRNDQNIRNNQILPSKQNDIRILATRPISKIIAQQDLVSDAQQGNDQNSIINGQDHSSAAVTAVSNKNGKYYLGIMYRESARLSSLCSTAEKDLSLSLPEEVNGKIRAAIGKATLLVTKKFVQFRGLCEENLKQDPADEYRTRSEDLAGFWDMMFIQVEEVHSLFDELDKLRSNSWKEQKASNSEAGTVTKRVATTKKSSGPTRSKLGGPATADALKSINVQEAVKPKSNRAQEAARLREEARRALLAAKKAGQKQRRTSQGDDDVEIFVT